MNISTSLICCDLCNIKKDVDFLVDHGFKWLHADFMDGHFVPRYGISPELIQAIRKRYDKDEIIIDSHMMVSDPYTYADVIAPYSDWYIFHYEAVTDPFKTLQMLRKRYPDLKIGLAFNLCTTPKTVTDIIGLLGEQYIDGVMFMGISPGVLGTNSMPKIVEEKLLTVNNLYPWCKTFVDGSVNFTTLPEYKNLNAYTIVCGSSTMYKDVSNPGRYEKQLENINRINSLLK